MQGEARSASHSGLRASLTEAFFDKNASHSSGLQPHRKHWCGHGLAVHRPPLGKGHASRIAGLWVVRAPIAAPSTNGAHPMQSIVSPELNDAAKSKASRKKQLGKQAVSIKPAKPKIVSALKTPPHRADVEHAHHTTKQELVLSMLSQKGGTTIPEIMEATGWQMHSVRGFNASSSFKQQRPPKVRPPSQAPIKPSVAQHEELKPLAEMQQTRPGAPFADRSDRPAWAARCRRGPCRELRDVRNPADGPRSPGGD